MTSKAIILGVGLPMVIFGAFIALAIAPMAEGVESTIEFVGSLIGILGVVFMISGLFYKKEAMGIGDVQLALICGLLFDWKGAAVALYISFISASVIGIIKLKIIKSEDKIIPFGPFIAFGSVISFIFSEQILGLFFDLYF